MLQRLCFPMILLATFIIAGAGSISAEPSPPSPQVRLSATWQGQELATVLDRISATTKVSIWLDRRVNPHQQVNAQFADVSLAEALDQLFVDAHLGWSPWGELVYVGPREAAREFATLMAIARKSVDNLPAQRRESWLGSSSVKWPRLSDPRDILVAWLSEAGITLINPETLSHDLWNAKQLPAMPLIDRVVLLLVGYDKTCEIAPHGRTCRIVPINRPVVLTEEYSPGNRMRNLITELESVPSVTLNRRGGRLEVTGRWEDQMRVREILAGSSSGRLTAPRTPQRRGQRLFSLRLENQPLGTVLDQLARQLDLNVQWQLAPKLQDELHAKLISCDVQNVSLEVLLEELLGSAGLGYSLAEKRLTIRPRHDPAGR